MVVANITVSASTGKIEIAVEVLGKGPRPGTAWVQALNGLQPFTRLTHGGPCQEDSAVVSIPRLRELRIVNNTQQDQFDEALVPVQMQEESQIALPVDWFPALEDVLGTRRSGDRQT